MSTIPGKAPALKLPPQVETPRGLLGEHLAKLLTVEETLAKRLLPRLIEEVEDEELKGALQEHLKETKAHVLRVRDAFAALGEEPRGRPALGLDGLGVERESFVPDVAPGMRAAANCEAAMGTEHYEINAYDAAIRLAGELELGEVATALRANLAEETAALEQLARHSERLTHLAVHENAVR